MGYIVIRFCSETPCTWSEWINENYANGGADMYYPAEYMAGMESSHSNQYEDRRFKFKGKKISRLIWGKK